MARYLKAHCPYYCILLRVKFYNNLSDIYDLNLCFWSQLKKEENDITAYYESA